MTVIPYGRQNLNTADIRAVVKVLRSDWLTQGPQVLKFEKKLAQYCGTRYAVAVGTGTAALHLAYLAADLKPGDEVITTPNTFAATTNMMLVLGLKPIFCDIRLDTYNIDETKIAKLITPRTKMIVPVHFAGQACAMREILGLAKKHRLMVVEDGCHALGARYRGVRIGSLKSLMTVFSFHPVKPITTGEGGAIVTNDKKYYDRLRLLRNHGIKKDHRGFNVMTELGFNYRLTDIQAALGASQLARLDQFINKRRQIARWYKKELAKINQIILPEEVENCRSGWHLYVIRVKNPKLRNPLIAHLKKKNIGANLHYPAVYSHPYYQKNGYRHLKLDNAEIYQRSCLTLPCHTKLTRADINYIAKIIKNAC